MVCVYTVVCKNNFLVQFGYGSKRDMGSFFLMSIGSEEEVEHKVNDAISALPKRIKWIFDY